MRTDELNNNHLIADEGKVLRRLSDGWIAGKEIYLGYAYYLNEVLLSEPLQELPEHYEEIDAEEEIILDEETELIEVVSDEETTGSSDKMVPKESEKVTLSDYRALEAKVKALMEMLGVN